MTAEVVQLPTPERLRKDKIEVFAEQINDHNGDIGRPFKVVNILAVMEGSGSISKAMQAAGTRFQDDFDRAQLVALHAADMGRVPGGSYLNVAQSIMSARDRVWDALLAVGGMTSPCGQIVWHVLGEQQAITEWAERAGWAGRAIDRRAAQGILVGALGALLAHYDRCDRENR